MSDLMILNGRKSSPYDLQDKGMSRRLGNCKVPTQIPEVASYGAIAMSAVAMRGIDFESLAYGLLPSPTMLTPHHLPSPQYAYNKCPGTKISSFLSTV
jgi:hypothetical protein